MANNTYHLFFHSSSPFSNFHPCEYTINSNKFYWSEQGFMYDKAIQFGDYEIARKILRVTNPKQAKVYGRAIKNFKEDTWNQLKYRIMYKHVKAKFEQSIELKQKLLSINEYHFAEASPYDKIWGIGLNKEDAIKIQPNEWPGKNLLGKILEEVYNELLTN